MSLPPFHISAYIKFSPIGKYKKFPQQTVGFINEKSYRILKNIVQSKGTPV